MPFLRCNGWSWKCKRESNVSVGQRKVTLLLATVAICRFPDDCTHKCIVTVASLFFKQSLLASLCLLPRIKYKAHCTQLGIKDSRIKINSLGPAKFVVFLVVNTFHSVPFSLLTFKMEESEEALLRSTHWYLFVELYTQFKLAVTLSFCCEA